MGLAERVVRTTPHPTQNATMPKDENGKRRRATENGKVRCIELHTQGKSYREIEQITEVSKAEVQSFVHHWVSERTFKLSTPIEIGWGIFKRRYRKAVWRR